MFFNHTWSAYVPRVREATEDEKRRRKPTSIRMRRPSRLMAVLIGDMMFTEDIPVT